MPEAISDVETLPLLGLPGATENENVPSSVGEELERTLDNPYVTVPEGGMVTETAPPNLRLQISSVESRRLRREQIGFLSWNENSKLQRRELKNCKQPNCTIGQ